MTIYTAFTVLPDHDSAEALALAVENLDPVPLGVSWIDLEDGTNRHEVGGYFETRPDDIALAILASIHNAPEFVVSKVDERDWVAQVRRELSPVHAGRFIVHGGHDRDAVPENKIGLEIEAAMAFGTGHHQTTLGCLLATEDLIRSGFVPANMADIGTGTGVLAMAAGRVWRHLRGIASDIEDQSVATARTNFRANHISPLIRPLRATGFEHPELHKGAPYDLVYANILANPLRLLAPDMATHTTRGGYIILSGILNRQAALVIATYRAHGFFLVKHRKIGEWTTLTLRNRAK